jgi:hypothetical protein
VNEIIRLLQLASIVDRYTWALCGLTLGFVTGYIVGRK